MRSVSACVLPDGSYGYLTISQARAPIVKRDADWRHPQRPCLRPALGASDLPVLRVPIALEVGDERRAEVTIGLLARVNGGIAAKEIKRLLANPEGAAVADGANGAGAGQPRDNALDRRIHFGGRRDLVADQAAVGAIAGQSALIKNGLTRDAIAGEPRQAQIGEAWNDSFLAGRQGDEGVGGGENVVHDEKRLAMAADGECVERGDP